MSESIFDWIERELPGAKVLRGPAAIDRIARVLRESDVSEKEIAAFERVKRGKTDS